MTDPEHGKSAPVRVNPAALAVAPIRECGADALRGRARGRRRHGAAAADPEVAIQPLRLRGRRQSCARRRGYLGGWQALRVGSIGKRGGGPVPRAPITTTASTPAPPRARGTPRAAGPSPAASAAGTCPGGASGADDCRSPGRPCRTAGSIPRRGARRPPPPCRRGRQAARRSRARDR